MSAFQFPQGVIPETELLLDQTGSMTYATSRTNDTPRYQTLSMGIKQIIDALAQVDRDEGAGQTEEGEGGCYTVGFADGYAYDHGDINPENFAKWWASLRWGGSTRIMPGYNACMREFRKVLTKEPNSVLLLLYVGDGGGDDFDAFEKAVSSNPQVYVTAAIIGYGNDHDRAMRDFTALAQTNTHVRVQDFGSVSAEELAAGLLSMLG